MKFLIAHTWNEKDDIEIDFKNSLKNFTGNMEVILKRFIFSKETQTTNQIFTGNIKFSNPIESWSNDKINIEIKYDSKIPLLTFFTKIINEKIIDSIVLNEYQRLYHLSGRNNETLHLPETHQKYYQEAFALDNKISFKFQITTSPNTNGNPNTIRFIKENINGIWKDSIPKFISINNKIILKHNKNCEIEFKFNAKNINYNFNKLKGDLQVVLYETALTTNQNLKDDTFYKIKLRVNDRTDYDLGYINDKSTIIVSDFISIKEKIINKLKINLIDLSDNSNIITSSGTCFFYFK